jgi:DNA-directed RNA polymerase specialized sigma24 family protein
MGHRAYQGTKGEHLKRPAGVAPTARWDVDIDSRLAYGDERKASRKATKEERERERSAELRERYDALYELGHAAQVVPLLDQWRQMDSSTGAETKQAFLEPLIRRVQNDPDKHKAELVFLLVVFGPIRGAAIKALRGASFVERADLRSIDKAHRSAARMINEMEDERLESAADEAVLTAIARYPQNSPTALFSWFKATVGFRLVDFVRSELEGLAPKGALAAEHQAVMNVLDDLSELDGPPMAIESPKCRGVLKVARADGLPAVAEDYRDHREIRDVCHRAVGRLSSGQQQVIQNVVLGDCPADELAARRGVTRSTIYNLKAQAEKRLTNDDLFFVELSNLRAVRDSARLSYVVAKHPHGYLLDGRRRVVIAA